MISQQGQYTPKQLVTASLIQYLASLIKDHDAKQSTGNFSLVNDYDTRKSYAKKFRAQLVAQHNQLLADSDLDGTEAE